MNLLVDAHVFDGKFQGTRTYLEGLYTHMTQHQDIEFFFAAHEEKKLENILKFLKMSVIAIITNISMTFITINK